jgi:hypothetical protein
LEDYLRFACASVAGFVDEAIKGVVRAEPGILLRDLLERVKDIAKSDDIYLLLAAGDTVGALVVAPDPRESDLRRATAAEDKRSRSGSMTARSRIVSPVIKYATWTK